MKMTIGLSMAMALMIATPYSALAQTADDGQSAASGAANDATQAANDAANDVLGYQSQSEVGDTTANNSGSVDTAVAEGAQEAARINDAPLEDRSESALNRANRADDAQRDREQTQRNQDQRNREAQDANRNREGAQNWTQNDRDGRRQGDRQWRQSQRQLQQLTDQQRTAPWRFVQRDGVWWYRTPMNTWMVQRGGQWRPFARTTGYRGAQVNGQYNNQYGANQYDSGQGYQQGQAVQSGQYADRPAGYQQAQQGSQQDWSNSDSNQVAYTENQSQQPGMNHRGVQGDYGQHPSIGRTEWMCIDGRMRKVTVVAVSSTPNAEGSQRNSSQSNGYESAPPAPTPADQDSSDRMTPPPVPQPSDAQADRDRNTPNAPTKERLMNASGETGSNSPQQQTVRKPVTDETSAAAQEARSATASESAIQPMEDNASGYDQDDMFGGPSQGLNETDSLGGDAAPERR